MSDIAPIAWMKSFPPTSTVDGPGEWEVDFYYGDRPNGDGWQPMYSHATITALREEVEEARREHADTVTQLLAPTLRNVHALQDELTALRRRVVEVVRPFAAVAEKIAGMNPGWDHDDFMLKVGSDPARLGPYRAARALVNEIKETTDG